MKRVTIIRHGMPAAHHSYANLKWISGSGILDFINDWNSCELSQENRVPEKLKVLVANVDKGVSSRLKRSVDSLRLLGISGTESTDLLNEAELPYGFWKNVKLPIGLWAVLIRLFWVLGYAKKAESFGKFKTRIKKAGDYIETHSMRYDHIAVMGHGFANMQLKKEMKLHGWCHILNNGGHDYWSFDVFDR